MPKILNVGILAHVDAGKTSLTESFLFQGGATKQKGDVDKGTSQSDFLDVEKERGISVRSAVSTFTWKNVQINLIDTPGHVDFSSDVERAIRVLDCAILVVSAVDGVQAHTETLFKTLHENKIPTIFFINKIDRIGADVELVFEEIQRELTADIILTQRVLDEETNDVSVESSWNEDDITDYVFEKISEYNENIMEKYLSDEDISFSDLDNAFVESVNKNLLYPILLGSVKNEVGITNLLDYLVKNIHVQIHKNDALSALIFRIDHDKVLGKVAGIRIFSGSLKNRDIVKNTSQNIEEKVTQIKRYKGNKFEDVTNAEEGEIVAVCGLTDSNIGDILGSVENVRTEVNFVEPLLTVQVIAKNDNDYAALAEALQMLSKEDPALHFEWLKDEKELHVKIMGWIQIQILEKILLDRFNIEAEFKEPTVIYKETPKKAGEGFVRYWMPKPCWAILRFKIEPGELGSGVVYESKISVDKVHQKYQNEVARTIPIALQQGIKGWEVTDIKITLTDGEDHEVHSRPGDFVIATPMGIMNGLVNTDTVFLEPYISFKISATDDLLGAIAGDITQMRGSFESPQIENGKFTMAGVLPLATSLDFPVKLSSRSGGKAKISTKFHSYKPCTDEQGVIRPFKGINPLDEAKYILKARKAIQ